jgi:hypothetical protein
MGYSQRAGLAEVRVLVFRSPAIAAQLKILS